MNFFSADLHFNHENIIRFCCRPFRNAAHMNAELIRRYNERVKPGDTCYHIGDFKLSNAGPNTHELLGMLNGNKVLLAGNHDKNNSVNTPLKFCVIEQYGRKIVLAHRPEDCDFYMGLLGIDLGFCGHVHEKWAFKKGGYGDLINVGVDVWDFTPVDGKQIFKAYKKWRQDENSQASENQRPQYCS